MLLKPSPHFPNSANMEKRTEIRADSEKDQEHKIVDCHPVQRTATPNRLIKRRLLPYCGLDRP